MSLALRSGQIVLADWRGGALPGEANKRRPAIVVDDDELFDPDWDTTLLVPLTDLATAVIKELVILITPTPENGCTKPCWAVPYLVTATSKRRVIPTSSCVDASQLAQIRRNIALAIGR
jgi:mRNA interferase MazF